MVVQIMLSTKLLASKTHDVSLKAIFEKRLTEVCNSSSGVVSPLIASELRGSLRMCFEVKILLIFRDLVSLG